MCLLLTNGATGHDHTTSVFDHDGGGGASGEAAIPNGMLLQ